MEANVNGEAETQRRSYPGIRGQFGTRGWELVRELDLLANAPRIAEEARELLTAPLCPSLDATDLIIGSEQMALQIHESVGHAVELDRILGWEAAFAGTSWLDLEQLGSLRFGSDLMNVTADATLPGALGSFGYDDEGTPAHPVDIVRDGIWVGVLSGRDSAALAGLDSSGGAVRGDGYNRLPMVRMTNVGLLPGTSSLEEMIAATDDGLLIDTNRSWSIDDKRLNFQFGCEIGWEIKGGKRGRMIKNPTYTGIGPRFWQSLDMLGNESEWTFWGTPNCGKGQPGQIGHTGHPGGPVSVPRRAGGGALMSAEPLLEICDRVLRLVGTDAEAEITVTSGTESLTRFATSFIHQNVTDASRDASPARGPRRAGRRGDRQPDR